MSKMIKIDVVEKEDGLYLRIETGIERKEDDDSKEEISPRKDKGDLRIGLDPAYVDPGSTGKLYCDRCGCWLGRAEQD